MKIPTKILKVILALLLSALAYGLTIGLRQLGIEDTTVKIKLEKTNTSDTSVSLITEKKYNTIRSLSGASRIS